jgi:hypothetical protein
MIIITSFSSIDNLCVHKAYATTEYGKGLKMQVSNSSREKRFSFSETSRPALGLTQPSLWVPWVLHLGKPAPAVRVTTSLDLVQRSRLNGALPALP